MGLSLIKFLLRNSKDLAYSHSTIALVFVTGILGGASSIALITLINAVLVHGRTPLYLWGFLALCLLLPISRFASEAMLIRLSQRTSLEIRMLLSHRIVAAPLRTLEELGGPRLMAVLTDDIMTISNVLTGLPAACMNLVIVLGCLAYIGWLSPLGLLVVVAFLAIGTVIYRSLTMAGIRLLRLARHDQDALFVHFRALTQGNKELKLSAARREAFLTGCLQPTAQSFSEHNRAGLTAYTAAAAWGQALLFLLIALLMFQAPSWGVLRGGDVVVFVLTTLYMMTPLTSVLGILPTLSRANIAVQRVEGICETLAPRPLADGGRALAAAASGIAGPVDLVDIRHAYRRERDNSSFVLGPITLTFRPGEIVFLTGGNGSGKTTLAKLLIGLYTPETGEIRLAGKPIGPAELNEYRENFGVVFADYYLFDSLLGVDGTEVDDRARQYLVTLQLDHKVQVADGAFSTLDLSQGQRRRLALLAAYLDDRPFYVFDEWAADQDPQFKDVFYLELVPELKRRGKTVLVISHDDRYYHVADRVIKLEDGRVVSQSRHRTEAAVPTLS